MIKSNLGKLSCMGGGARILDIPPSFNRSTRILAVGLSHVCAVGESEPLMCWGSNIFGQNDVQVEGWVRLVAAGSNQTIVVTHTSLDVQGRDIRRAGGSNGVGNESGNGNGNQAEYISNVQGGGSHFCQLYLVKSIRDADGGQLVECQGSNTFGQTSIDANRNINSLAAGQNHTCVVEDSFNMQCQGINSLYQISPPYSDKILQVRSKSNLTCVDRSDNSITCWGGKSLNIVFLLRLSQNEVLKFLSVGQDHICQVYVDAVDDELSNHLICKDISNRTRMVDLNTPENILDTQVRTMSLGESNSCFVLNRSYQNLKCIGKNRHGLNDVPSEFNNKITFVDTEFHHTCANRLDEIRCWGNCSDGNCDIPRVDGMLASKMFGVGVNYTCMLFHREGDEGVPELIRDDEHFEGNGNGVGDDNNSAGENQQREINDNTIPTSKIVCFGNNDMDQLNPPISTADPASDDINNMSVGSQHSCLVMRSRHIACWGANISGQATVPSTSLNTPLLSLRIACGFQHTCVVDPQNRLHCWGRHTRAKQPQPGSQHALLVAAGSNQSCAVLKDLQTECWGEGEQGQTHAQSGLALNTYMVQSGQHHSCALLNDGQVACWGRNHKGQIDDMELGQFEYEEVD